MKADYLRYLAEVATGKVRTDYAEKALVSYDLATDMASGYLLKANPIKLALALNFSVFYYEILNKSEKACEIAKCTFDDAVAKLDQISEENYKDSTLIMQLLRDNMTLWECGNGL